MLPNGTTPVSIGLNPLTGRGLVANISTKLATSIDLTGLTSAIPTVCPTQIGGTVSPPTPTIGTGLAPAVAIEPRLNWALITPGGAGRGAIVDLGGPGCTGRMAAPIANLPPSTSIQGIAINSETEQVLLTDPNSTAFNLFSLLEQVTNQVTLDAGEVAAAVNPLTDVGVTVNNVSGHANILDLRAKTLIEAVTVGSNPQSVAIDPGTNVAVVVNQGTPPAPGTVSVLSLGTIRPLHLTQISAPTTFTTTTVPLTLTVTGHGFTPGSTVRLDETPVNSSQVGGTVNFVSDRQLTATIPASALTTPRRYIVDVVDGANISNATDLAVIGAVPVGTSPVAVAVDSEHKLDIVTNSGSNNISFVDLTGAAAPTTLAVGINPQGVAVLPRLKRAVVTNHGDNSASIVDYSTASPSVVSTVSFNFAPLGVAIQPDTAQAVVALVGSSTIAVFVVNTNTAPTAAIVAVGQQPLSVAIDPSRNLAAVTTADQPQNSVVLVNLANFSIAGRVTNGILNPFGVAFDPVSDMFLVANSELSSLAIVDPGTLQVSSAVLLGISPTSVDYNFQSSTAVSVNTASNSVSIVDFLGKRVRAVLALSGSSSSSVAIDLGTNIAVIADQSNNRVLRVPLPR
jgi:DNA-binding beta-propeller fold protein YncE